VYEFFRQILFNSFFLKYFIRYDGDQYFIKEQKFHLVKNLLDFGCHEGRQLKIYQSLNENVYGFEFNEKSANVARLNGFSVTSGAIKNLDKIGIKFDRIILSNVIEHLNDPLNTIKFLKKLLTNQGQILISCPNYNSVFRTVFKNSWSNYHVPFHISHFDLKSLTKLCDLSSMKLISYSYVSPSHGLSYSILNFFNVSDKKSNYILLILMMLFCLTIFKPIIFLINLFNKGDIIKVIYEKE
jgi:SAM-dependent methyltransferase